MTGTTYKRDLKLYEMLKGKTIAYVGPSPHLIGTNSGEKIDSYDLVCRVGQDFPLPENRMMDYGKRTDILLSSCNEPALKMLEPYADSDYFKNLKYVICPSKRLLPTGGNKEENFQKINKYNIPFHIIGKEYTNEIDDRFGCSATSGIAGIIALLNYELKEIYVTGITFYDMWQGNQTFEQLHYPEYTEHHEKVGIARTIRAGIEFGHFQPPQILFFSCLLKRFNNITLDDFLKKYFKSISVF